MKKILDFISLKKGEEAREKVLENVKANTSFRGSNLWILACAIVIASIGLNVNSAAVIIGAMLISPLMGPIVGTGFALGILDLSLLKKSLKNLIVATFVSLLVSAAYFYISPFKETQSELLSRTNPNIYDVLIAFLGGLVGVIAITRVEKGNPIPGVAIATALMPPLCTAGYGLAVGNLAYFAGALYLYMINSVFICLSTFLIVKYLKYPAVFEIDKNRQMRIRNGITALLIILIIPSIYIAYNLISEKKYNQSVIDFIDKELISNGYVLIYKKVDFYSQPKKIELAFLTKKFSPPELQLLNDKLKYYGIENSQLIIKQDTTDIKKIIKGELEGTQSLLNEKELRIAELEKKLNSRIYDNESILSETKILFPEIQTISIADHSFSVSKDSADVIPVLIYKSKKDLSAPVKYKLIEWLKKKLNKPKIQLFRL
ncbi:MAG: DUF389 domain-containing protein [Ignavibacteriaceae bacterium]|nr:DUF389 domain-containing protein [Ignavibacteriaceae bacterium]